MRLPWEIYWIYWTPNFERGLCGKKDCKKTDRKSLPGGEEDKSDLLQTQFGSEESNWCKWIPLGDCRRSRSIKFCSSLITDRLKSKDSEKGFGLRQNLTGVLFHGGDGGGTIYSMLLPRTRCILEARIRPLKCFAGVWLILFLVLGCHKSCTSSWKTRQKRRNLNFLPS